MLFKINYDVPANTAKASEDWQKLKIAKGTLVEWIVTQPKECADLMQFRVEYHGTQILPFTRNEYVYGMFEPTVFTESIEIDIPPYVLDVYAYNLDTKYSHEYNLYVNILPKKPFTPETPGFNFKDAWSRIFGGGD
ncbi:MAG: hypothetical protein KAJ10_05260 [Thermodesulfovibrionia bacterium]|nr:hypothetical protein [Thermodesulfovibrionia bacterium]